MLAIGAAVLLLLAACTGSNDRPSLIGRPKKHTTTTTSTTTTTIPPTTTTLPVGTRFVAYAKPPQLQIFNQPGDPQPAMTLANPWLVNDDPTAKVPLLFLVLERNAFGWIRVLLPVRPNGSSGWVRASDVDLQSTRYRIDISLSSHRIQVFNGDQPVYDGPVAVGTAATPTPAGSYFIRVLIKAPNPNTVYGPYAYGLSSHSDALNTFNGGDAEIGIHGNNDASVLGKNVTHGCVRIDNNAITQLAGTLPLGTPVEITP